MTVSYQNEVASSTSGGFTRLLLKWRGSLYKLLYRELALFCGAYAAVFVMYSFILTPEQKQIFDMLRNYCNYFINLLPLSFVLGFYVSFVADRWWQQYTAIPWPDKILHSIALYVQGADDHSRMIRRTMVRYLNLSLVLLLRSISSAVKRRLPTLDHLVESGFMTAAELEEFSSVPRKEFNTYWIPCCWFMSLLREARSTNHVVDSQGLKLIVETFNEFRANCGLLWSYDWVSIPLVYTQVVTIATYTFFVACLVGRQQEAVYAQRTPDGSEVDFYIPLFTILQFLFYMGLLKVAEQLINPFGDDDEDFELNWIIDRHVKVSYLIVDSLNIRRPPLTRDMYFDDPGMVLPYTEASVQYKIPTYRGSVHSMKVPEKQHTLVMPEIKEESNESEEEDDENIFGSTSLNSIPENGPVDGRDPRVGAMSVPDEALLSGSGRNSATSAASKTRLTRLSDSAGSCGSNRRLDIAGVEAAPQTDPPALSRPRLEPQLSTVTNTSTGDESSSPRRNSLAPGGNESIIRRESMSAPNRSQPRLPKRSSSWQSPSIIPPRWRRRKKTEVIWHPYIPPTASEQSLADSGSPDVTCLVSPEGNAWPNHDDCERGNGRARMPECYRRSVPSVFVQAPSIRVRVPAGAARSRQSWAGGPGISRSLDERGAAPLSPSYHSPTASEPPLCPSRSSPTEGDLFASARQLTGVTEDDEPHTGEDGGGQGPIMFSAPDPLSFPTVAGSLPDIQQGASPSASSTLERKHSLPVSAHKRVQIVAPCEVERILAAPIQPVMGRHSPVPPSSSTLATSIQPAMSRYSPVPPSSLTPATSIQPTMSTHSPASPSSSTPPISIQPPMSRYSPVPPSSSTPAASIQPTMSRYSPVPPSSSTPAASIQPTMSTHSPVSPSSSTPATSVLTPPTRRSSANTEGSPRPPAPNGRTAREARDARKQAQRKRP